MSEDFDYGMPEVQPLPGLGSPLSQKERDWRKMVEDRLKLIEEAHLKGIYDRLDKLWEERKWRVKVPDNG